MKTPWLLAFVFYFAFLWRGLLLFFVLMIPYYLFYGLILLALEQHPLIERLIRLTVLLGAVILALSWGFQWAMRAKFGSWTLRVTTAQVPSDSSGANPPGLTLRQAAKVVWAHLWRYAVVGAPLTMALLQLRFARQVMPLSDWPTFLKVESINVPLGLLIGTWAMRQAATLNYSDFHLQWIEAAPMPKEIADSPIKEEGRDGDGPKG